MDLFCTPDEASIPTPRCPYVCSDHWDGGVFRDYAQRMGRLRTIPPTLRGNATEDEPYLENIYPTPREELEPFLQTWLFFGLLAEFLSLNEITPGVRLLDEKAAMEQIKKLHADCRLEDGGSQYLTAAMVLDLGPLMRERLSLVPASEKEQRLVYLLRCLEAAVLILNSVRVGLDDRIRNSIAALGELFTTSMYLTASLAGLRGKLPTIGFNWFRNFIKNKGNLEAQMIENGWCMSEIEKIRSQFQGVFTMHYVSRLRLPEPHRDHSACSVHACQAFQMDMKTYQPRHTSKNCTCTHLEVPQSAVVEILRSSDGYPVLRVDVDSQSDVPRVSVEGWRPGVEYVAFSHVWADGLGNPNRNSLPRCQINKIAQLVKSLQAQLRTDLNEDVPKPYYIWIDTLCCPIELEDKVIALERISDVYRQAKHVLVLDSALTSFESENKHPAELLLRTFGISPWMRRLWTLQEGALSQSLYLQFADRAVDSLDLLKSLFELGNKDSRYMRMWQDVINEFNHLQSLSAKKAASGVTYFQRLPAQLTHLQRSLHFRTVSVPSDEPLCIATLMELNTRYIAEADGLESRMARAWELISRANGDCLPVRIIFFLDQALTLSGWRWAPSSLLSSSFKDPTLGLDERTVRFDTLQSSAWGNSSCSSVGIPTKQGLKVALPGCRLELKPRRPGLPLHPWPEIIHPCEDQVLMRDDSGKWVRIIDWYRSEKNKTWTKEERLAYDRREDGPLCRCLDTGNCALIYDVLPSFATTRVACMVQIEKAIEGSDTAVLETDELADALKTHRQRSVMMSPLSSSEEIMMDIVEELADTIAADHVTFDLLGIESRSGEEWEDALTRVRNKMKDAVREAWNKHPGLRQAASENIGADIEEYLWVLIPKCFSHTIRMVSLPDDQTWFVD